MVPIVIVQLPAPLVSGEEQLVTGVPEESVAVTVTLPVGVPEICAATLNGTVNAVPAFTLPGSVTVVSVFALFTLNTPFT